MIRLCDVTWRGVIGRLQYNRKFQIFIFLIGYINANKGNTKHGVSLPLKNWPGDLDLWPMTLKINRVPDSPKNYVPSLVNIHWRMLILECSHGCYAVQNWPGDLDLWPMTLIINRFLILLRTKYVPRLVKIHWRMLILECSQGCYGRTDGRTDGRTVALLYPVATSLVIYE